MLSKNQVKFINSLKDKKGRKELGLFIAEGEKIVAELLESEVCVQNVYATEEGLKTIDARHKTKDIRQKTEDSRLRTQDPGLRTQDSRLMTHDSVLITEEELKKISTLTTPNQLLAICEIPKHVLNIESLKDQLTLLLDDIRDPGNLGTIIRIADWFGIKDIICSEDCVDAYNPKTVQATMGSIARVKIHYSRLEEILNLKYVPVYGALLEGENIYRKKLSSKGLIIIGNESRGISQSLLPFITDKISIPSFGDSNNSAESLNAAIATAVICSEFRRNI